MNDRLDPSLAKQLAAGGPDQKVDALFAYMEARGQSFYDEVVTQLEHALQCAHQARQAGVEPIQVAAALLHDIGHFLIDEHGDDNDFLTEDFLHEEVGAAYLEPFFVDAVTVPVKLHVPAKRYICSVDAAYYETLSAASKRSFALQGGFMTDAEKAAFEAKPFYREAVELRKWDDLAKEKNMAMDGLEAYREAVVGGLR